MGEAIELGRWSVSPKNAVKEAVAVPEVVSSPGRRWKAVFAKGADDISEIPAIRRFREGLRWCEKSAEGTYPESPEVGGAVSLIGR